MSLNVDLNTYAQLFTSYSPAVDNLYTIEIYPKGSNVEASEISNYLRYHATSFTFEEEKLLLERHPVTKNFKVTSEPYTWAGAFTITWREQDDWYVRKFHEEWLSKIYNKREGVFRSKIDVNDIYKDFKIILPKSKKNTNSKSCLKLYDVLPSNIGGLQMQWNTTGNVVSRQLTYYVKEWEWVDN